MGAALGCVGISSTTNDGICMAFCDVPADPADPFDPGFQGSCPTGYECSLDLGVALVFGPWLDAWGYVESRAEALTCNPLSCPEGLNARVLPSSGGSVRGDSNRFGGQHLQRLLHALPVLPSGLNRLFRVFNLL